MNESNIEVERVIIYDESLPHSDDLICLIDFDNEKAIVDGDIFSVQWNTNGTITLNE